MASMARGPWWLVWPFVALFGCAGEAGAPGDLAEADAVDDLGQPPADTAQAVDTAVGLDNSSVADAPAPLDVVLGEIPTSCPCEPGCPTAVLTVTPGAQVNPFEQLTLSADGSHGAGGIVHHQWEVDRPVGSVELIHPVWPPVDLGDVGFSPLVAGNYRFRLVVADASGARSCPAEQVVAAVPHLPVHIELTWHTPGDPDESDVGFSGSGSAGSDLDLHLLSPGPVDEGYPGGWFHPIHDTYWGLYAFGIPGSVQPGGPDMNRDDTDGAGPEIITIPSPTDGATYRIGVHAWEDWGFGPSYARVRVYVHGQLVFELGDVLLLGGGAGVGDLWEVADIAWPSGEVTVVPNPDAPGEPFIRHGYRDPRMP